MQALNEWAKIYKLGLFDSKHVDPSRLDVKGRGRRSIPTILLLKCPWLHMSIMGPPPYTFLSHTALTLPPSCASYSFMIRLLPVKCSTP